MQQFPKYAKDWKSIRSIVKNIGSEWAELRQQYLAYFVWLLGLLWSWSRDMPNMDISTNSWRTEGDLIVAQVPRPLDLNGLK